MVTLRKISFTVLLLLFSYSAFLVPMTNAITSSKDSMQVLSDENGIRIVVTDVELYFNASNGGEITEYYDLTVDPLRLRNLANMSLIQSHQRPFCSLTTSLFYNPNTTIAYGTGPDSSATVKIIINETDYIILQTSSKVMGLSGRVISDGKNNPLYINSTWLIFSDGRIFLERMLHIKTPILVPSGWRWYPFYSTRTLGFNETGTYFMFNTTYSYTTTIDQASYDNSYSSFATFPMDQNNVFGIAVPFADKQLGGDGGHNLIIVYKYEELNVSEWKSDNYNGPRWQTEFGAVHQFSNDTKFFSNRYQISFQLTHQPIDQFNITEYAEYFEEIVSQVFPLNKIWLWPNKSTLTYGEHLMLKISGLTSYEFKSMTARFTILDEHNNILSSQFYGPFNSFSFTNRTLLDTTIPPNVESGKYKFLFQVYSQLGILLGQNSTEISIIG